MSRGQPERPLPRIMFRDNRDEPLQTAQDRTMDDHGSRRRLVCRVVGGPVLEVEPLGELEVELNGGALEGSFERVADGDVDLGPIKCAVAWVQFPFSGVFFIEGAAELLWENGQWDQYNNSLCGDGNLQLPLHSMSRWHRGNCPGVWRVQDGTRIRTSHRCAS